MGQAKLRAVHAGETLSNPPKPLAPSTIARPDQARAWLEAAIGAAAEHQFCEIVDVTPELARHLLSMNEENRHLSPGLVGQIATDLREGRWQFNGESIVISKDGKLNDGQHRLEAVAESNVTARMVIVGGVDRESRMTLDMGRARTVDDYLTLNGVPYAHVTAASARMVCGFERGGRRTFAMRNLSKSEAIQRGMSDKKLHDAVKWAVREGPQAAHLVTASQLATCYYILEAIDPKRGPEYMQAIAEGANQPRHSAVLSVRRYLPTHGTRHREPKLGLVLRGWTFWKRGASADFGELHGRFPLPPLD